MLAKIAGELREHLFRKTCNASCKTNKLAPTEGVDFRQPPQNYLYCNSLLKQDCSKAMKLLGRLYTSLHLFPAGISRLPLTELYPTSLRVSCSTADDIAASCVKGRAENHCLCSASLTMLLGIHEQQGPWLDPFAIDRWFWRWDVVGTVFPGAVCV